MLKSRAQLGSRFLVLAAVLGALAGAAALFIYGLVDTVVVIAKTIADRRDFHRWREAVDALFHRDLRFIPARHRDADHGALALRAVL